MPTYPRIEGVEISGELGRGAHSIVYRAERDQRAYAVKLQRDDLGEDAPELDRRFAREAAALARLDHPSLPSVWSLGQTDGRKFLVMDLFEGTPLDEHLGESGPLPSTEVARIGTGIAGALAALHGAGFIHRDIKPSNVIWDGRRARLVDFGLVTGTVAEKLDSEDDEPSASESVAGTFAYASPEQIRALKRPVTPRSDLYSLGALLFECCTGRPPFEFERVEDLIQKLATDTPPQVGRLAPDLPKALASIIDRLLSKDPDDRYPDAATTSRALAESLSDIAPDADTDSVAPAHPDPDSSAPFRLAGRRKQEANLRAAWLDVRQTGEGEVAIIHGAPGMGKTALVRRFASTVRAEAGRLLRGDCAEESHFSLGTLRSLVHSAWELSEAPARESELAEALDAISASDAVRRFLTDRLEADALEGPDALSETEKFVGEIVRLLVHLAARFEPALLILEGYERADRMTEYAIRRFCSHLSEAPVLVVITMDDRHTQSDRRLDNLREQIDLEHATSAPGDTGKSTVDITLDPLETEEISTFTQLYLKHRLEDEELLEYLRSASRGNPFVLRQLIDTLLEHEVLRPDWETWRVDRERLVEIELPSSVRNLLVTRLDEIDVETRELCTAGAVWGPSFPLEPVAECVGHDIERAGAALEVALQADILELDQRGEGDAYRFIHDSIRHALLERLPPSRSESIHQYFGEWLDERGASVLEIADHFLEGDGSNPERTYRALVDAGRKAAANYDFERTRKYLEPSTRIAVEQSLEVSPDVWFLLGWVYAEIEDLDRAQPYLERAAEEAEDPVAAARYELKLVGIHTARFEHEQMREGARRCLARLGEPMPSSTAGQVLSVVIWKLLELFVDGSGPEMDEMDEMDGAEEAPERDRLLLETYNKLIIVGALNEWRALLLYSNLARGRQSRKMPLSPESAVGEVNHAILRALMGQTERARTLIDRAYEIAEAIDDPFARSRVELGDAWARHIAGAPVRAARMAESTLRNRGDQLAFLPRSLGIQELCVNFGLRGHARKVLYWYRQWRSMHGARAGEMPPGPIYARTVASARSVGEDDLADHLLEASRSLTSDTENDYLRRLHHTGKLADRIAANAPPDELETALEERMAFDPDPDRDVFWAKSVFIYAAYARRRLLRMGREEDRSRRIEDFAEAVEELERAADGHPTYESHAHVLRAELEYRRGKRAEAFAGLGRAEQIAVEYDNQWVVLELEQLRAEWYRKMSREEQANRFGELAAARARQIGWLPLAKQLHERYEPERESTPTTVRSKSTRVSDVSPEQLEARRKLDALLEVSMATSSILDPDEVARVVVDSAIQVLGAGRGFLFLSADPPVRDVSELDMEVFIGRDESETEDPGRHSKTVLDQIVESGEPMVVRGTEQGAELGAESIVAHELRSIIAAPLFVDDALVGVIYLDNRLAKGVFDERDVEVLRAIANHVPIALETARAAQLEVDVAAEREKRRYAERLRTFTSDVNELFDVPKILERLLQELHNLIGFESGWGGRIRDGTIVLQRRARGDSIEPVQSGGRELDLPEPGDYLRKVVETGATHVISHVEREDREREPFIGGSARSWMALPLTSGAAEIVGIVALSDDQPEAFESTRLELVRTMADQAGLAIEKTLLATVDPLTGEHNRRKLFELAEREFARARRHEMPLCVLLLDIDDFKEINDRHGHSVGDAVLRELSDVLFEALRETDILGRYGGEEFAVILPQTELEEARDVVAERLRSATEDHRFDTDAGVLDITVSVGVAAAREGDDDIRRIVERADEAMYDAKSRGKNRASSARPPRHLGEATS